MGIAALALNGAAIGKHHLVGTGAIVTERKVFPGHSLRWGVPAKGVRELTNADLASLERGAADYALRATTCQAALECVT